MARGYKTKRVIEMKKRPRGKEKRRKIQSVEKLQKSEFICHVINIYSYEFFYTDYLTFIHL